MAQVVAHEFAVTELAAVVGAGSDGAATGWRLTTLKPSPDACVCSNPMLFRDFYIFSGRF
jgi:hypothetical protein